MCSNLFNTGCSFNQVRNTVKSLHAGFCESWNENMHPFRLLKNKMEALHQSGSMPLRTYQQNKNQNIRGQRYKCNGRDIKKLQQKKEKMSKRIKHAIQARLLCHQSAHLLGAWLSAGFYSIGRPILAFLAFYISFCFGYSP